MRLRQPQVKQPGQRKRDHRQENGPHEASAFFHDQPGADARADELPRAHREPDAPQDFSRRDEDRERGEIAHGVENNPTPDLQLFLAEVLPMPVAEFGEAEALEWGRMTSAAIQQGLKMEMRDTMIAATASARGWTVATRNISDFTPLGVIVFNPWTDHL